MDISLGGFAMPVRKFEFLTAGLWAKSIARFTGIYNIRTSLGLNTYGWEQTHATVRTSLQGHLATSATSQSDSPHLTVSDSNAMNIIANVADDLQSVLEQSGGRVADVMGMVTSNGVTQHETRPDRQVGEEG